MYRSLLKRIIDTVVALVLFVLLLPVFLLIIILLFLTTDQAPFFTQVRPGKNEKLFRLIKLKSMNEKKDADGKLLPDAERLTRMGSFLRKTSLDEIPQLLNVLAGNMSLVGPRPLLVEYLPLYSNFQSRRHEVLPGITGWAQVNGRNAIGWKEKFEYDVWYVDHISFALDLKIIMLTIRKVFIREGINAGEQVTMQKFSGNTES
ncbi:MAG: sugar transferase [Sediminibacterium sp.]|nr:sugar transferase [Sediminibacterium sp.]